jgi:hypothetical protein
MNTDLFWTLRGTYEEKKEKLSKMTREYLEAAILDTTYNNFIENLENSNTTGSKQIPYIGWYWRFVTFSKPTSIRIGKCSEFIGFMVNNKWDYPERTLTQEEANKIIEFLDEAMRIHQGESSEKSMDIVLSELWDYMQTLNIKDNWYDRE